MAYVDLNPIRAAIADTPETSDYTSIKERIQPTFNLDPERWCDRATALEETYLDYREPRRRSVA